MTVTLLDGFFFQPPWDTELADRYIIHYTYGCDYTLEVINLAFDFSRHLILVLLPSVSSLRLIRMSRMAI